jgi:hypothetical protein
MALRVVFVDPENICDGDKEVPENLERENRGCFRMDSTGTSSQDWTGGSNAGENHR